MSVDPDAFRAILGRFASGVTVATVVDERGRDHGMTVSAFASVSLEPPLVLVCIDDHASIRPIIDRVRYFGVSILAADQEALARRFAAKGDRFDGVGYERGETGVALLEGALAWLECEVVARHQAGDHAVVVGRVEGGTNHDDRPLLYYRGGYAQLER